MDMYTEEDSEGRGAGEHNIIWKTMKFLAKEKYSPQ